MIGNAGQILHGSDQQMRRRRRLTKKALSLKTVQAENERTIEDNRVRGRQVYNGTEDIA